MAILAFHRMRYLWAFFKMTTPTLAGLLFMNSVLNFWCFGFFCLMTLRSSTLEVAILFVMVAGFTLEILLMGNVLKRDYRLFAEVGNLYRTLGFIGSERANQRDSEYQQRCGDDDYWPVHD